jgi:hypothetical protein
MGTQLSVLSRLRFEVHGVGLLEGTESVGQLVSRASLILGFNRELRSGAKKDGADSVRSRCGCQYLMGEGNQLRAVTVVAGSVDKKASDAYCRWPISVATLGVADHP